MCAGLQEGKCFENIRKVQLSHKFGVWNCCLANDLIPFLHLDGTNAASLVYNNCKLRTQTNQKLGALDLLKYCTLIMVAAIFLDLSQCIMYLVSYFASVKDFLDMPCVQLSFCFIEELSWKYIVLLPAVWATKVST